MARTGGPRDLIDQTVEAWKARCLLADGSLTQPDRETTWSKENVADLDQRFNGTPLAGTEGGGSFGSKWRQQLSGASADVRLLAAEMLMVHFLFASSVSGKGKLQISEISLEGTGITLDATSVPVRALGQGIGHPGIGFNTRRDLQVGYLINFVLRFKQLDAAQRDGLLGDPWLLGDFADEAPMPIREMRHVLMHLLRPDDFERISSATHKREIVTAFADVLDQAPGDIDQSLLKIRNMLTNYVKPNDPVSKLIDFYHAPLRDVWLSGYAGTGDGASDLESLMWKKQLILYGPPGTSKTYQAREIAETVIRREALKTWKPKKFFSHQSEINEIITTNVEWVQLHPGYGYPEFMRGLQLEGNDTRYRPGLLPTLIDRMNKQQAIDGDQALPFVLVLDEINRTDLSAMFGEAFSLLESDKRGIAVTLPGINQDEERVKLAIPKDLYIIGTMNEIDQSVETLDYALRRRFLWRECPFERDTLLAIIRTRWEHDVPTRTRTEGADEQLERFADRAAAMNDAIAESAELGRAYQIGHTFFADISFFIGTWAATKTTAPPNGTYLWTKSGAPQPAMNDLWDRSLRPLLQQYLSGTDLPDAELTRLRQIFFRP